VIIILSLDAPKSICETEISPKNPLVWAKRPKKKPKKNQKKTKKKPKNPLGWFFFLNPGFFQPCFCHIMYLTVKSGILEPQKSGSGSRAF
jgi:hypothetical protein